MLIFSPESGLPCLFSMNSPVLMCGMVLSMTLLPAFLFILSVLLFIFPCTFVSALGLSLVCYLIVSTCSVLASLSIYTLLFLSLFVKSYCALMTLSQSCFPSFHVQCLAFPGFSMFFFFFTYGYSFFNASCLFFDLIIKYMLRLHTCILPLTSTHYSFS